MADGGGGDGAEGGGSADWQPIFHRVEAMVSKSQEQAASLAADREAADMLQRESWDVARRLQRSVEELQAVAREKDAEMDMLRAEAADARKKLQAGTGEKMKWEKAYMELLLGASQKLVELRDDDLEDSRTLAENINYKEMGSCTKLNQNTMDQIASDLSAELRKLKHAYETLSSKKDNEVSALLSEKDSVSNQLSIMHQDYVNKKVEAAQATEAALKLQHSVDEFKVLAQQKDDEIGRLQADAVEAEKNLLKMHSLVKEKDDEIQRLKGPCPESIQKCIKDTSEAHENFRFDEPDARSKLKNSDLMKMVEDYIRQTGTIGKYWQDEPRQKCRRVSFISNDHEQSESDDDEQSESDEDDDEHSRHDEHDEDEQGGRNEERTNNPVQEPFGTPKRKRDACNTRFVNGKATVKTMVRNQWYWYHIAPAPLCSQKLQIRNGQHCVMSTGNWAQYVRDVKVILVDQPDKHKMFIEFLCNFENWRVEDVARTMAFLLDGHPELIYRFNWFLPKYWQIEIEEDEGEKHQPDESAAAAAGLIKLKEAEAAALAGSGLVVFTNR